MMRDFLILCAGWVSAAVLWGAVLWVAGQVRERRMAQSIDRRRRELEAEGMLPSESQGVRR